MEVEVPARTSARPGRLAMFGMSAEGQQRHHSVRRVHEMRQTGRVTFHSLGKPDGPYRTDSVCFSTISRIERRGGFDARNIVSNCNLSTQSQRRICWTTNGSDRHKSDVLQWSTVYRYLA